MAWEHKQPTLGRRRCCRWRLPLDNLYALDRAQQRAFTGRDMRLDDQQCGGPAGAYLSALVQAVFHCFTGDVR